MLYLPELAVVASVFQELLIVPVGNIFGSQNAPSWFTTPAEIRAHMANCLPYAAEDYDLAEALIIPDEPDEETRRTFRQSWTGGTKVVLPFRRNRGIIQCL
jgi:hypothetical protein